MSMTWQERQAMEDHEDPLLPLDLVVVYGLEDESLAGQEGIVTDVVKDPASDTTFFKVSLKSGQEVRARKENLFKFGELNEFSDFRADEAKIPRTATGEELRPGDIVELRGLSKKALNGQWATVLPMRGDTGKRVAVKLESGHEVSVKCHNLQKVTRPRRRDGMRARGKSIGGVQEQGYRDEDMKVDNAKSTPTRQTQSFQGLACQARCKSFKPAVNLNHGSDAANLVSSTMVRPGRQPPAEEDTSTSRNSSCCGSPTSGVKGEMVPELEEMGKVTRLDGHRLLGGSGENAEPKSESKAETLGSSQCAPTGGGPFDVDAALPAGLVPAPLLDLEEEVRTGADPRQGPCTTNVEEIPVAAPSAQAQDRTSASPSLDLGPEDSAGQKAGQADREHLTSIGTDRTHEIGLQSMVVRENDLSNKEAKEEKDMDPVPVQKVCSTARRRALSEPVVGKEWDFSDSVEKATTLSPAATKVEPQRPLNFQGEQENTKADCGAKLEELLLNEIVELVNVRNSDLSGQRAKVKRLQLKEGHEGRLGLKLLSSGKTVSVKRSNVRRLCPEEMCEVKVHGGSHVSFAIDDLVQYQGRSRPELAGQPGKIVPQDGLPDWRFAVQLESGKILSVRREQLKKVLPDTGSEAKDAWQTPSPSLAASPRLTHQKDRSAAGVLQKPAKRLITREDLGHGATDDASGLERKGREQTNCDASGFAEDAPSNQELPTEGVAAANEGGDNTGTRGVVGGPEAVRRWVAAPNQHQLARWCEELQLPSELVSRLEAEDVADPRDLAAVSDGDLAGFVSGIKIGPKGRFLTAVRKMRSDLMEKEMEEG